MTCTHTSTLGVYLLGALEPEDRSGFEAHLSRCDTCRAELVRLAPLPGLLNQITIADFDDASGPPTLPALSSESVAVAELPEPVLVAELPDPFEIADPEPVIYDMPAVAPMEMRERPRPRRPYWFIAAAAALVIALTVGGIATYVALRGPSGNQPSEVTWSATNPRNGVRADARLIKHDWGTEIQIAMDNVPAGKSCRLVVWAKGANGYRETAGWWATPGEHPEGEIPASTSIDLSMIYKLEVVDADTALLVDLHPPA